MRCDMRGWCCVYSRTVARVDTCQECVVQYVVIRMSDIVYGHTYEVCAMFTV